MFLLLSRYTGSVSTAQEHSINTGMNSMTRRQCKHVKGVLVLETGTALRSIHGASEPLSRGWDCSQAVISPQEYGRSLGGASAAPVPKGNDIRQTVC